MEKKYSKINYRVCGLPDKPIVYVLCGKNGDMPVIAPGHGNLIISERAFY